MTKIHNNFIQCYAFTHTNSCVNIFIAISCIQMVIFAVGFTLNTIIIASFFQKQYLRRKIPNILFFNQAVADLVNMTVYLLPNIIHMLYQVISHKLILDFHLLNLASFYLSLASSTAIFAIISIDRLISVQKPFWHRVNVQKRHLWKAVVFAWFMSLMLAAAWIIIVYLPVKTKRQIAVKYNEVFGYIKIVVMITVTLTFVVNFIKAVRSVRSQQNQAATDRIRTRKQFRLTLIFFTMFMFYVLAFLPGSYLTANKVCTQDSHYNVCMQTIVCAFILSSIFNPVLTLYFKKEFRWRSSTNHTQDASHKSSSAAVVRNNSSESSSL